MEAMALEPAKLADFEVRGALGAGTTARVYEAVHRATGREVAIKVLEAAEVSPEIRERFAREALFLSGVDSAHVAKILGFGFERGKPFLVLERLVGETLDAKLRRDGPVPPSLAVRWLEELMMGVRDCHDVKIIHRDIKPSNVFLHRSGFDESVKLIDFGVARLREIASGKESLTSTNHLIGSVGYMAPEQFHNPKAVGFPADVYALGIVVFRTFTGRLPFVSRSFEALLKMKSDLDVPPISSIDGMPQNALLDRFLRRATVRRPEERFANGREMLEAWWQIIASFDDDAKTEVMRASRRHDETLKSARESTREVATQRTAPVSHDRLSVDVEIEVELSDPEVDEDERTLRRRPPSDAPTLDGQPPPSDYPTRSDARNKKLASEERERVTRKRRT